MGDCDVGDSFGDYVGKPMSGFRIVTGGAIVVGDNAKDCHGDCVVRNRI